MVGVFIIFILPLPEIFNWMVSDSLADNDDLLIFDDKVNLPTAPLKSAGAGFGKGNTSMFTAADDNDFFTSW